MKPHRHNENVPLAYCGQDVQRRAHLGQPFTQHGYGHDGARVYRFNRLGFRGPEFDPEARRRIYAFGESHAFGYFVDAEQCWPARFAALWSEAQGLTPSEVCFQNFADVGAANSAVARGLVSQCTAAPPDLVLVHFGEHLRSEVFLEGRPHRIGAWLLEDATREAAPADGPLRAGYLEQIERGKSFYRYAFGDGDVDPARFDLERDATCVEQTLRNILLVQYFCQARGIPAIATCDLVDSLFNDAVRGNASLGPLLSQIDPNFLSPLRIWSVDGDRAQDNGHAGPLRHDRFARTLLEDHLQAEVTLSSVSHDLGTPSPSDVGDTDPDDRVRRFYDDLPFNHWRDAESAARSIRQSNALDAYPDLQRLLETGEVRQVLECGCGAGWLACSLALHHDVQVTAVDFSSSALARARQVAAVLGVEDRVRFVEHDLRTLELETPVDLVISLGVLHHTVDAEDAFHRIAAYTKPDGHLYVGLYHRPGREPFLRYFRQLAVAGGEEAALDAFRVMAQDWSEDEEHLRSWFRDQVLHPQESQHTLQEVLGWLGEVGGELLSTSINRFAAFETVEELFDLEEGYRERSETALQEGRFFPGFFTFLLRLQGRR